MNSRLVIVWIVAILLFGGIGLVGYMNRDLALKTESVTSTPAVGSTTIKHTCKAVIGGNDSSYIFDTLNGAVSRLSINYTAKAQDIDGYTVASGLNTKVSNIAGLSATMSGGVADYSFTITFTPAAYDTVKANDLATDFGKLSMVVDSITNYEMYKQAISQFGVYACT